MPTSKCNCGVHSMSRKLRELRSKRNTPDWAYNVDTYQHYGSAVHPVDCRCFTCNQEWLIKVRDETDRLVLLHSHDEMMAACV